MDLWDKKLDKKIMTITPPILSGNRCIFNLLFPCESHIIGKYVCKVVSFLPNTHHTVETKHGLRNGKDMIEKMQEKLIPIS